MIDDWPGRIAAARCRVAEAFAPPPVPHDDIAVSWHPVVLSAFAGAALSDALLDAVYAANPALLAHKHITVACPVLADGMGDLALAWRVCAALGRHAPTSHISLAVPDPAAAEMFRDRQGAVHVVAVAEAFETILQCDLLLVAPDPTAARYSSAAMQAWIDEAATRYPTLAVTEYGSGAAQHSRWRTLATGLGPLADGIFIDPDHAMAARSHRMATPHARIAAMHAWVEATVPWLPSRAWAALHVLYVREPDALQPALARALGTYAGDMSTLLVCVLRHTPTASDAAAWQRAGLPVALHPSSAGQHAQVVALGSLPPAQFRTALLYADFAAVTGDQSLGEAIAAQVPFVYETRAHKQTLTHRLQEIASRFGLDVHGAMAPLGDVPRRPNIPIDGWQAMCRHLCDAWDVTPRLVGRAARTLHAVGEPLALEASVAAVCAQDPTPAGDAQLQQLLARLQARLVL